MQQTSIPTATAPSNTITIVEQQPNPETSQSHIIGTISLSARETEERPRVSWSQDTIDNEFLNKKKSKICCIYHKPKSSFDESSDEECDSDCEKNAYEKQPDYSKSQKSKSSSSSSKASNKSCE